MAARHCCAMMTTFAEWRCEQHPPYGCPHYLVGYDEQLRRYRLLIHDGEGGEATSGIVIRFCPWCGVQLSTRPDVAE